MGEGGGGGALLGSLQLPRHTSHALACFEPKQVLKEAVKRSHDLSIVSALVLPGVLADPWYRCASDSCREKVGQPSM